MNPIVPHCSASVWRRFVVLRRIILISIAVAPMAGVAHAKVLPKWELGAGVLGMRLPDYRGSDEYRSYLFPLPYIVYRGERLQVDRRGASGLLFESKNAEIDISANATNPASSHRNRAREGMPDLDPTVELGPRLRLTILERPARGTKLTVEFPVRAVFGVDFSDPGYNGWVANPLINLDVRDVRGSGWSIGTQVGPVFADRRYHGHFYGVKSAYARADRPAYSARGGYSGTQISLGVSKRYASTWVGGFVRAYSLHGAVFEDSPLVRTRSSVLVGFGIAYVFAVSGTKVDVDE